MRLQSAARARSVDGTVARGKMADAKNRSETRNVYVQENRTCAVGRRGKGKGGEGWFMVTVVTSVTAASNGR